jgi:tRNA-specific 2-thiouridylase
MFLKKKRKIVFVGLSGGVDSSVSAYLLKKKGYEVYGAFIHSYNLDGCEVRDAEDARLVSEELKIPFYVFDFENEYKESVINYMVGAYKKGFTPNPDMMCNKFIKFGIFLEKAKKLGAHFIATGHYAILKKKNGVHLYKGKDEKKDQSYFLAQVKKEALENVILPLGEFTKEKVRKIAEEAKLHTAYKKDSQGICFLGKVTLYDFLKSFLPEKPGKIITLDGEEVGVHKGLHFYTIGQRHLGVEIKPQKTKMHPIYVVDKDYKNNVLIVAEGENNPALFKDEIILSDINLLQDCSYFNFNEILMRVRYRQPLFEAQIFDFDEKEKTCRVKFKKPQKFIAPGQFAVFYNKKGEVLGSGVICP